jgi:mannan endo-1,4-beta-mannosidase
VRHHRALFGRFSALAPVLLALALPACGASASNAPLAVPASAAERNDAARGARPPLNRIRHGGRDLYLSGFNIAWFDFAADIGKGVDEARLRQAIADLLAAGGNTLRWWIHTDGTTTPEWGMVNGQRRVVGPGASFIADLRRALDIAAENDVFIVPSLWSFDMLRDNPVRHPPVQDNVRLLTQDAVLDSYLEEALTPMVRELGGHPALVAWELFNEPENMTEGWFKNDKASTAARCPRSSNCSGCRARWQPRSIARRASRARRRWSPPAPSRWGSIPPTWRAEGTCTATIG